MTERGSPRRRRLVGALVVLVVILCACFAFARRGLGGTSEGPRLERMHRSPQWRDGAFVNPEPLQNDVVGSFTGVFDASDHGSPEPPLVVPAIPPSRFEVAPASGLRVTWLGHSTTLVEIDGRRVLFDPVFSEVPSPLPPIGPSVFFPNPIAIDELPRLDAVVVSHDHYDHLDEPTIRALASRDLRFVVPLGLGAHLEFWGVPRDRIDELDWWERASLGDVEVVCVPARHASGRRVVDQDETLWAGFALLGAAHRVYYSGDTGLFRGMRTIGERLGPFDLALVEVGQYHRAWPDWHIGPEQAVEATLRVRAAAILPVHWGRLALAYHGWTEPAERVLAESRRRDVRILLPRPGESVEPATAPPGARWWPAIPFEGPSVHPIVSHDAR